VENKNQQSDETYTPHDSDLKKDIERVVNVLFPPEARHHVMRATTEMILAVDSVIPKGLVPQEVKNQYEVVRKETVTLVKTIAHAATNPSQAGDESKTEEKEEKGLKKIEFS
jgi:hypothetical protein